MPVTTRYSATFDCPYEEEERSLSNPAASNGMRRSRSQSWQANLGLDGGRPYTPSDNSRPSPRSASTDSGPTKTVEAIPTRTLSKPVVKSHNNPFQFVKVGSSPLYRKAEEQLKKVKEVKKVDVLKEEEEEWQSNLDSWKSRRRKMSEDVFKRQEEIRQLEQEQQQCPQANQKKIKTFSEMVESRAHRGRTLSLCLISSPLELQEWELENNDSKNNGTHSYSEGSEENSVVNSEDEGVGVKGIVQRNLMNKKSQSSENILNNGSIMAKTKTKLFELSENGFSPSNGNYFDSGLESISSSHRAGDTPDSCSDFSQDSGSCIDCDSPRVSGLNLNGINVLEEFNSKELQNNATHSSSTKKTEDEIKSWNSPIFHDKMNGNQASVSNGSDATKDQSQEKENGNSFSSMHFSSSSSEHLESSDNSPLKQERSIESENEVFVDDFEELNIKESALHHDHKPKASDSNSINTKKNIKDTVSEASSNQKSNLLVNEDGLNVIFHSDVVKDDSTKTANERKIDTTKEQVVLKDVPPVEQVAEEMERLILQQLEEEERAKESSSKMATEILDSPEHNLIFRSRSAEPPKEKPPPPPCTESEMPKSSSLKRVNSTKRIKKEIYKRRSNFLGIENDDNAVSDDLAIPPPPALEQILKAEMELDRESRKRLENATTQRLILEENEIRKKEQEIIEIMETEERQKQLIINCDDFSDVKSDCTEVCDIIQEGDRIEVLKEERKRMEKERMLSEEQRLRLIEEKQLREREEFIKKQEAVNPPFAESSVPLLSGVANLSIDTNKPFLSPETELKNVSELKSNGERETIPSAKISAFSEQDNNQVLENSNISNKPVVPPKPLKKKEAIRRERERLRQEQEALVREREEHRRKLKEEEEQLRIHQNSHAPDAPVSRLGPLPSLIKPVYAPQLTSPISAQPSVRENAAISSRNFHAAQNSLANGSGFNEPVSGSKRNKPIPPPKKTVKSELRGQQKMPSIKKQSLDGLADSKYNQNHWLIQEAEIRRITELKERQRAPQFPNTQTHLAEDDVCSVSSRVPVLSTNAHLSNPVQEKIWKHGHSNVAIKKYPPPPSSDKPIVTYAREQPPAKPSRIVPLERQEQMLSVSGRKRCSHCNEELGRGAAMIIESLQLYYHIHCFQCCVCQAQLGNGSCGTDVRVRNNKLHCHNCYSNDEAGLKFSQV